jgi:hypothetical protein
MLEFYLLNITQCVLAFGVFPEEISKEWNPWASTFAFKFELIFEALIDRSSDSRFFSLVKLEHENRGLEIPIFDELQWGPMGMTS